MRIHLVSSTTLRVESACRHARLYSAGMALLAALYTQGACAGDYMKALEAEAADVKPAEQQVTETQAAAKPAEKKASGEDSYLSALEAEADDLESQQTKKKREESTGVRFSRIRY